MPSYILSEPYKQRVDRALSVVEGQPSQGGVTTIPTRFETLPQPASNPLNLAAYARDFVWRKGSTAEVTLYTQSDSSYAPAMETLSDGSQIPRTVSVTNVSNDFDVPNLYGTSEDVGPTPTMTWCIVGKPKSADQYVVVEGPVAPVRLATITTQEIGDQWQKNSVKIVEITATGKTAEVYSVLDSYTKLDFQNGLVYTKSVDPQDPTKTANVVISPPAIPLHEARFSEGNIDEDWARGQTKQLIVDREDGEQVEVSVVNKFYDSLKPGTAALAIGRFGTTFSVITGQGGGKVTPGTLVTPIDPAEKWDAGTLRGIRITGTSTEVEVLNPFEELTPLDGHRGVLFAESDKDPLGGEGTVNILISPAPKELFEARFSQGNEDEEWEKGQTKDLVVPAGGGRAEDIIVPVANKFFDTLKPGTHAMAIGKIDGEFCVITKDAEGGKVTPGTLVTPIDPAEKWDAGTLRGIRITGTSTEVEVLNPFEELTPLDGHRGVLFAESDKDPLGGEGTVNILISPAPKELFEAKFSDGNADEEWARGETKDLIVPAGAGRDEDIIVPVANKFFDTFSPGTDPLAIGKIDGEFCVLTGAAPESVKMANRTDNSTWDRGSQKDVRIHGTTVNVTAVNLAGHYEAWDARSEPQGPNLVIVKGKNLGVSEGTMWYVISPSPQTFRTGTFTGQWAKGTSKSVTLLAESGPTGTVTVTNKFATVGTTVSGSSARSCGISKAGSSWFLVAAECD